MNRQCFLILIQTVRMITNSHTDYSTPVVRSSTSNGLLLINFNSFDIISMSEKIKQNENRPGPNKNSTSSPWSNVCPYIRIDLDRSLTIFQTFFDYELFEHIQIHTELYAPQNNTNVTVSTEVIKSFVGLLSIMRFPELPTLRSYRSNDSNFLVDRISNIMSPKRF